MGLCAVCQGWRTAVGRSGRVGRAPAVLAWAGQVGAQEAGPESQWPLCQNLSLFHKRVSVSSQREEAMGLGPFALFGDCEEGVYPVKQGVFIFLIVFKVCTR